MPDDPLLMAPEMAPFVTGEELLRRREDGRTELGGGDSRCHTLNDEAAKAAIAALVKEMGGELSERDDLVFLRRQAERATHERERLGRPRR